MIPQKQKKNAQKSTVQKKPEKNISSHIDTRGRSKRAIDSYSTIQSKRNTSFLWQKRFLTADI